MKKLIFTLLSALVTFGIGAQNFSYTYEGCELYYKVLDAGSRTCSVTGGSTGTDLVIPDVAYYNNQEYEVVEIGYRAFMNNTWVKSVFVGKNVTKFGEDAFWGCSSLVKMARPNVISGAIYISKYSSFQDIVHYDPDNFVIEDGIMYDQSKETLLYVPYTFAGNFIVPETVKSIGRLAFASCSDLTSIQFSDNLESINYKSFKNCTGLNSIIIGKRVNSVSSGAFEGCNALWKAAYPNTITQNPFANTTTTLAYDPNDATIEDGWVYDSAKQTILYAPYELTGEYEVPETITTIGSRAFERCISLSSIAMPASVETIGESAFSTCTQLGEVNIANPNIAIGASAFAGLTNLKSATIGASSAATDTPQGSIGDNAFDGCSSLETINISAGIASIGENAFNNCFRLTSIIIPSAKLSAYSFNNCTWLSSVILGKDVTSVDYRAFLGCKYLVKSAYPNTFKSNPIQGSTTLPYYYGDFVTYDPTGAIIEDGWIYGSNKESILYAPHTYGGNITIPASVTNIGKKAFIGCKDIYTLTIENPNIKIEAEAFNGLSALTSVTIGDVDTPVENPTGGIYGYEGAFGGCTSLKNVVIGNGFNVVPSFSGCTSLTTVTLGNNVRIITMGAFENCTALTKINISNSVEKIGDDAFRNCNLYSSEISFDSVEYIGDSAFENTAIHGEIVLNAIKTIGESAFKNCNRLTSVILGKDYNSDGSIPIEGVDQFTNCNLIKVAVPNTSKVEWGEWYDNKLLTYKTFVKNLIIYDANDFLIEDGFVYNVDKTSIYFAPVDLEEYTISEDIKTIGENAFSDCKTTKLYAPATVPAMNDNSFDGLYNSCQLNVPDASVSSYLATNWSLFKNIKLSDSQEDIIEYDDDVLTYRLDPATSTATITGLVNKNATSVTVPERFTYTENGENARYYIKSVGYKAFMGSNLNGITFNSRNTIESIGDYAFAKSYVTKLVLPSTVNSIGKSAFSGCSSLKSVEIPAAVTEIEDDTFNGCKRLNNASFLSNVTSIGNRAFYACEALTEVSFNDQLQSIGTEAFASAGLESVTLPNSLQSVSDSAFQSCTYLADVNFGENITTIGVSSFEDCYTLSTLTLPDALLTIGDRAFYNTIGEWWEPYSKLTVVNFGNSLQSIGNDSFNGCQKIKSLKFPDSLRSIGNNNFVYCANLREVSFGKGLETIGDNAFYQCNNIPSLSFPDALQSIGDKAFQDCRSVSEISFGEGLKTIGNSAFSSTKIQSIELPIALQSIGEYAFYGSSSLTSVKLNDGLVSIGKGVFNGSQLSEIVIPGSVETIGDNAFGTNCRSIDFAYGTGDIAIGTGMSPEVLKINRPISSFNALPPLANVTDLTIGNDVEEIPASTFSGLTKLANLYIGTNVANIGWSAFSSCNALKSVVLPPAIQTIEASAFDGTKLNSITMGYNVASIGEKAFNGCPAKMVAITAQTPPEAPNNTFSYYTGTLYLQGEEAIEAYYDAWTCWDRFDSYKMIEATAITIDGDTQITGKPGEQFTLKATVMPADATLQHLFWRSTCPEIATVDNDGVVTIHADLNEQLLTASDEDTDATANVCHIIAETLYNNGPVAQVELRRDASGVELVYPDGGNFSDKNSDKIDYSAPYKVYNLGGVYQGNSINGLNCGFYIVRQNSAAEKIVIQ